MIIQGIEETVKHLFKPRAKEEKNMNEIMNALLKRRSCRSYKPDPIPQETLDQILEAGSYAASGMGRQSPVMIAVTDKALRDRLSRMNAAVMGVDSDPFYGAPVVIVVLADRNVPTYLYDGSLVIGSLMHAAHALGIGSCWIHRAKEEFDSEEEGKRSSSLSASRAIWRASVTAFWDMQMSPPAPPRPEKNTIFIGFNNRS